jgi:hypothetical protein
MFSTLRYGNNSIWAWRLSCLGRGNGILLIIFKPSRQPVQNGAVRHSFLTSASFSHVNNISPIHKMFVRSIQGGCNDPAFVEFSGLYRRID